MEITFEELSRLEPKLLKVKFCWHCGEGLRKGFALQLTINGKMRALHRKCGGGLSFEERAHAQLFKHGKYYAHPI